jgi:hypothetical protein
MASAQQGNGSLGTVDIPIRTLVDEHVFGKLEADGIPHAGLAGDEEFIRRVYIDAAGVLPSSDAVREFLTEDDPHLLFSRVLLSRLSAYLSHSVFGGHFLSHSILLQIVLIRKVSLSFSMDSVRNVLTGYTRDERKTSWQGGNGELDGQGALPFRRLAFLEIF